jgi:hypothetical protein
MNAKSKGDDNLLPNVFKEQMLDETLYWSCDNVPLPCSGVVQVILLLWTSRIRNSSIPPYKISSHIDPSIPNIILLSGCFVYQDFPDVMSSTVEILNPWIDDFPPLWLLLLHNDRDSDDGQKSFVAFSPYSAARKMLCACLSAKILKQTRRWGCNVTDVTNLHCYTHTILHSLSHCLNFYHNKISHSIGITMWLFLLFFRCKRTVKVVSLMANGIILITKRINGKKAYWLAWA